MKLFEGLRRRWRLWRICRKLGVKPYPWQRDFALGLSDRLEYPPGRQTGKTMAVILRLLLMDCENYHSAYWVLSADPDWTTESVNRVKWYEAEYVRMCRASGVTPLFSFRRFLNPWFRLGLTVRSWQEI